MGSGQAIDNTTMIIKVAGHEYCVTNKPKQHSKSHSLCNITDLGIQIEKTKIEKSFCGNTNYVSIKCNNKIDSKDNQRLYVKSKDSGMETSNILTNINVIKEDESMKLPTTAKAMVRFNTMYKISNVVLHWCEFFFTYQATCEFYDGYKIAKSKSEGDPFGSKKKGRIIKVNRPNFQGKI